METNATTFEHASAMPAPTWHFLDMNDTTIQIPDGLSVSPCVKVDGDWGTCSRVDGLLGERGIEHGTGAQASAFLRSVAGTGLVVEAAEGQEVDARIAVEAVPGGAEESAAELTEDEMVKEAAMTVSPDDVFIGETTPGSGTDEDDEEEEKETSLADGVVEAPAAQETREETVKTETGAGPKPSAAETLHAEPGEIVVPEGPGTVTRPAAETTVAPGPGTGTVAPVPAGP